MEVVFEVIFGIFGELLLQVAIEGLCELGLYSLAEALQRKRKRNPALAAAGCFLWGGILGVLSLLVFPESLIRQDKFRTANLIITPILAGVAMAGVGAWRRKRGQDLVRLDSFFYGALFALGMAIVRFLRAG